MKGYRTFIISAAIAVLGALQGLDWVHLFSKPEYAGYVMTGIGALMAALRAVTTTAPGKAQ